MKPSEILDKAADHIETYGHAKKEWIGVPDDLARPDEECAACAGGAINIAGGHPPDFDAYRHLSDDPAAQAWEAMANRVTSSIGLNTEMYGIKDAIGAVTGWNDEDDRTAEQVVAELRAAALEEREAGR